MFNRLVGPIGFGWAMRAIAFMFLGLLAIANLTCKSRLDHKPTPFKAMDFIRPLEETRFLFVVLGSFFFFWGLFLPINYIVSYAQFNGMSQSLAGYQLAILNTGRYESSPHCSALDERLLTHAKLVFSAESSQAGLPTTLAASML